MKNFFLLLFLNEANKRVFRIEQELLTKSIAEFISCSLYTDVFTDINNSTTTTWKKDKNKEKKSPKFYPILQMPNFLRHRKNESYVQVIDPKKKKKKFVLLNTKE